MIVYLLAQAVTSMKVTYAIIAFSPVNNVSQPLYVKRALRGLIITINLKAACCHALWVHIMLQLQTSNALAVLHHVKLAKIPPNALVVLLIILYMMQLVFESAHLNSMQMALVFAINAMGIAQLAQENIIASLA